MNEVKVSKKTVQDLTKLRHAMLDSKGREINNPKPLFVGIEPKSRSFHDEIQRILRVELSHQAQLQGRETFEESQDFDVEDGFEAQEQLSLYTMLDEEELIIPPPDSEESPEAPGKLEDSSPEEVKKTEEGKPSKPA